MLKFVTAVCLGLSMTSCAHQPKEPEDLRINQKHKLVGAPDAFKECSIVVRNIITIVPGPTGPVKIEEVSGGEKALLCGEIECPPPAQSGFACVPMSAVQSSSKSE